MIQLKTYIIPNSISFSKGADKAGINSIFIDLEQRGKNLRQGHLNTHKSSHQLTDIGNYRKSVKNAELLVRINPLWERTKEEVNFAINNGAEGGKLIGAGGAGFLMFYSSDQNFLQKKLMKKFNLKKLNFNFDFEGSKIIKI